MWEGGHCDCRFGKRPTMAFSLRNVRVRYALAAIVIVAIAGVYVAMQSGMVGLGAAGAAGEQSNTKSPPRDPDNVHLSDSQLGWVKVEPVEEREFPTERESIGSIQFNQEMTTDVFTPYSGRIITLFAKVGDDVTKGQTLFTIDSPDLLNAESNLIAAAGVSELTTRGLARLQELYKTRAVSQKDLEQAVSDQQTAEGNLRAARDSVRQFGKTNGELDRIIAQRIADPTLVIQSP